jgi:hypothetical protein
VAAPILAAGADLPPLSSSPAPPFKYPLQDSNL